MKRFMVAIITLILLSGCSTEAKIEDLQKEVDSLAARGKYLEAAEVQKEINALRQGEEYIRDEEPEKTAELEYKSNFEYLDIEETNIIWSSNSNTGELTGKIKNNGSKTLDGYFDIFFFGESDEIVKSYTIPVPEGGINPGETKYFSKLINKFDYSYYEFQGDTIVEK